MWLCVVEIPLSCASGAVERVEMSGGIHEKLFMWGEDCHVQHVRSMTAARASLSGLSWVTDVAGRLAITRRVSGVRSICRFSRVI